jgi:hypothetical protein
MVLNHSSTFNKKLGLHIFQILISLWLIQSVVSKKEVEIKEDFTAEIDYRLEKTNSQWTRRGVMNFLSKGSNKNYKSSVNVVNENLNPSHFDEIKSECENGNGLVYVRIKLGHNLFFSSAKSCDLYHSKFNDRFVINHLGSVKRDSVLSLSYGSDNSYLLGEALKLNKPAFNSQVDFVENIQSIGPLFPEEKEISKPGQAVGQENQSFLSKYWWIILIVFVIMMSKGPGPEEEGASQGAN